MTAFRSLSSFHLYKVCRGTPSSFASHSMFSQHLNRSTAIRQSDTRPFEEGVDWRDLWCSFAKLSYECGHSVPPGPPTKSKAPVFEPSFVFKHILNCRLPFPLRSSWFASTGSEQAITLARKAANKKRNQMNGACLAPPFSCSSTCLVWIPVAMKCVPSFDIVRKSRSPLLSMQVI